MNPYLKNLNKIEFVITNACTGTCKHCSEGDHCPSGEYIDSYLASNAVRMIASEYDIKTVMAFGGEPLLYADTVCSIIDTARELYIPRRQVITNGYFSKDENKICDTVRQLAECGVNDLLLSVDAFHQETIPLEVVRMFACHAKEECIPIRLQPAWLVDKNNENPYNKITREILASFDDLKIMVGDGNVIFPEGNARKYLADYFTENAPPNPYIEDPSDIRCISFLPNGDVLNENIYQKDIIDIINSYCLS